MTWEAMLTSAAITEILEQAPPVMGIILLISLMILWGAAAMLLMTLSGQWRKRAVQVRRLN
jgi:hypothetical protein